MTGHHATCRFVERVAIRCYPVGGLRHEESMVHGLRLTLEPRAMTRTLAAFVLSGGVFFPPAPHGGTRE